MKILILANTHLQSNTGLHVSSLARAMTALGARCDVCVVHGADQPAGAGDVHAFQVFDAAHMLASVERDPPDLVYLWTPREGNRKLLAEILHRVAVPHVVHFEDNEFHLAQVALRMSATDFARFAAGQRAGIVVPDHLSDPSTIAATVANSLGVTALVDELVDLVPQARSSLVFWPGYDETLSWGVEPDLVYRRQLGLPDDVYVLAYTGNLHSANAHEIRSLYLAVALLNRRGLRVRLIRTGADYAPLTDHGEELLREFAQDLGFVSRTDLPRLLSIADVLVQPGVPDAFNIYRFPSKLPEFLASGRPVLLPACNIGAYLANGEEAIVLPACNAAAIVDTLEKLLPDPARRIAIGAAGARFAAGKLQWSVAASRSLEFFERLLVSDPRP